MHYDIAEGSISIPFMLNQSDLIHSLSKFSKSSRTIYTLRRENYTSTDFQDKSNKTLLSSCLLNAIL